jgi:hypothetical protein
VTKEDYKPYQEIIFFCKEYERKHTCELRDSIITLESTVSLKPKLCAAEAEGETWLNEFLMVHAGFVHTEIILKDLLHNTMILIAGPVSEACHNSVLSIMNVVVDQVFKFSSLLILSAPCGDSEGHSAAPDRNSTCTPSEKKINSMYVP